MIVVTSEGLVRVDDRESRDARGDCESYSNKCEDFFHGRILSKGRFELYHSHPSICERWGGVMPGRPKLPGGSQS